ncbi:hypothetical protein LEMLEM_LOCUS12027 [Lemmus lemmus]
MEKRLFFTGLLEILYMGLGT